MNLLRFPICELALSKEEPLEKLSGKISLNFVRMLAVFSLFHGEAAKSLVACWKSMRFNRLRSSGCLFAIGRLGN